MTELSSSLTNFRKTRSVEQETMTMKKSGEIGEGQGRSNKNLRDAQST